jgi:hypothetical protein
VIVEQLDDGRPAGADGIAVTCPGDAVGVGYAHHRRLLALEALNGVGTLDLAGKLPFSLHRILRHAGTTGRYEGRPRWTRNAFTAITRVQIPSGTPNRILDLH